MNKIGRLAGLRYREIAIRLRASGFAFDRQALTTDDRIDGSRDVPTGSAGFMETWSW